MYIVPMWAACLPPSDPQKIAYAPEARRHGVCDRAFIATPKLSKHAERGPPRCGLRRWLRFKHKVRRRKDGASVAPSTVGS